MVLGLVKNNITVLESSCIYNEYVIYTKISHNDGIFYLYNILIPQSDTQALKAIDYVYKHSESLSDGVIIVGGDFNCTLDPELDHLGMPTERRPKISLALNNFINKLSLYDVWRRRNPDEKKYTWYRANPSSQHGVSKARLDRFFFPQLFCPPSLCVKYFPVLCLTTRL